MNGFYKFLLDLLIGSFLPFNEKRLLLLPIVYVRCSIRLLPMKKKIWRRTFFLFYVCKFNAATTARLLPAKVDMLKVSCQLFLFLCLNLGRSWILCLLTSSLIYGFSLCSMPRVQYFEQDKIKAHCENFVRQASLSLTIKMMATKHYYSFH